MTSVVLADDQALVRTGLRLILELAGVEVVGEAVDGAEAVELVRRTSPDVTLMDIRMPRMDGIEATRRIVLSGVRTRVLILTTFDADEAVLDALRAGAAGFLLKDAGRERLVEAVRTTAGGETRSRRPCSPGSSATTCAIRPRASTCRRSFRHSAHASWRCSGSSAPADPIRRSQTNW